MSNAVSRGYQGSRVISKKIKKNVNSGDRVILKINIEYPQISGAQTKQEKAINGFYETLASNFAFHCENTESKRITKICVNNPDFRPYGAVYKYFITRSCDKYLSVVTEIAHFDGYFSKTQRYSHIWDMEKGIMLPCEYFLMHLRKSALSVRREIAGMILEQVKNGSGEFTYTEKRVKKYAFGCRLHNYFLTENGIAFWFEKGTVAPESEGYPTFVIKCDIK